MQIETDDMLCHCSLLQSEISEKLNDFVAIIQEMFCCQSNTNFGVDFVTFIFPPQFFISATECQMFNFNHVDRLHHTGQVLEIE